MQKFKENQKVSFKLNGKTLNGSIQWIEHPFYKIATDEEYVSGQVDFGGVLGGDIIEPVAYWVKERDITDIDD
jgi:hypothetical protein